MRRRAGQRLRLALVGCIALAGDWSIFRRETPSADKPSAENMDLPPLAEQAMARLGAGLREVLDYAAARNVVDRLRAGAGHVDRLDAGLRGAARPARRPRPAADARRRPSALPGRNADRRPDPPLGAAAGQRPPRRHAPRRARAPDVRRRRDRLSARLAGIAEIGYTGGVYVELSRHSHEGPAAARRAFEFLQPIVVPSTG